MLSAKSRILTPTTLNLVKRCLPKPMPHFQKPTVEDFKTEEEFQVINYSGPPIHKNSYLESVGEGDLVYWRVTVLLHKVKRSQKDIKLPIGSHQSGVTFFDQI